MSLILGLDVGTAAGAAATKRDGYIQPCDLGDRTRTLPSVVVLHEDGTFLTGEEAERSAGAELVTVARDLRRDPMLQADPAVVGGQMSTPYAMLRALNVSAVERVCNQFGEVPTHVVVTHPAVPEGLRCDMVEQIADELFPGAMLVPEPVAATVKFACDCVLPAAGNVVVYDLGGGTLDLTLVRRDGDSFSILGQPSGMSELGGIDIDDMVLSHLDASLDGAIARLDLSDPTAVATLARLRTECRNAKERLSYKDEVTIDASLPENPALVTMQRSELEDLLLPRLDTSIDALEHLVERAGLRTSDVDALALIGGSARIPLVSELIRDRTRIPVVVDDEPELTVALGAAQMVDDDASTASVFPVAGMSLPALASVGAGGRTAPSPDPAARGQAAVGVAAGQATSGPVGVPTATSEGTGTRHAGRVAPTARSADAGGRSSRQRHKSSKDPGKLDLDYATLFGGRANTRLRRAVLACVVLGVVAAGTAFALLRLGGDTGSEGPGGRRVADRATVPAQKGVFDLEQPTDHNRDDALEAEDGDDTDEAGTETPDGPKGPQKPTPSSSDPVAAPPGEGTPPASSQRPSSTRPDRPTTSRPSSTTTVSSTTTTSTTTSTTTTTTPTTTTTEPPPPAD